MIIILRFWIISYTPAINLLEWRGLPKYLSLPEPITAILRNDQFLALSFGNDYLDENVPEYKKLSYRIQQTGSDGKTYSSEVVNVEAPDIGGNTLGILRLHSRISGKVCLY